MQEIRILFSPPEGRSHRVSLTDGEGKPIGVELSFEPFLSDDDYDNLRWYLEEFMDLPDGGAVIRAQRIEADLLLWGRRLHDAIFSAGQNHPQNQLAAIKCGNRAISPQARRPTIMARVFISDSPLTSARPITLMKGNPP